MDKTILMLSGYSCSGKDTLADFLVKKYSFCKLSFADSLKKLVISKYSLDPELVYTQEGKKSEILIRKVNGIEVYSKISVRNLLILEGMEARKSDPDIWTKKVIDQIELHKDYSRFVISDFRFPNEYKLLKEKYNGYVKTIRISRPDILISKDPSEHQLDYFIFDYAIDNDSTIDNFFNKVNFLHLG
ncbi:MAG TPA: hypothetical protein V6C58_14090 [Allocoleopsis sp.]